jgi:hypothetical protein
MFFTFLLVYFLVNQHTKVGTYTPTPTPKLRERYVAISGDTSAFLILRYGDTAAEVEKFYSSALHDAEQKGFHKFRYNFSGSEGFGFASLLQDGVFIMGKRGYKSFRDTLFLGKFEANYDTLHGSIIIPNYSNREVTYVRDAKFVDTEILVQDSLVKAFQLALYRGDKKTVANSIEFPLRVSFFKHYHQRKLLIIKNRAQLYRYYNKIFNTAEVHKLLSLSAPFWELQEIWRLGLGDIWEDGGWLNNPPKLSITAIGEGR